MARYPLQRHTVKGPLNLPVGERTATVGVRTAPGILLYVGSAIGGAAAPEVKEVSRGSDRTTARR